MKNKLTALICSLIFLMGACNDRETVNDTRCSDTPPTDELCNTIFRSWFYNGKMGKCQQISYSGCNPHGFTTEQECKKCSQGCVSQ